ncbi:MBL fold metallo-hydrolase [Haloarcula sp. JP-L23]|uniref:MBL fold metallo-hydrolase n=1 Tax=Haloarcula sp. JP-L23 TaxID=2716717 RepID=UPI00140F4CC2|nr:MBL fold metallo-hydrolase [Haloarcula sp. JP-L23]
MTTIRILVDDYVAETRPVGLQAEHGFAATVDGVLFDTGQTGLAAANAERLDLPTGYSEIVLSHGHYDHTGGLGAFLNDTEKVYAHPNAFDTKLLDGTYIGMPDRRARIEAATKVVTHKEPIEVSPGVYALGEVPRKYPDNPVGEVVEANGDTRPDQVLDDQSIAVETDDGTVLVCGCCHAGLRNTVEHAESVTGSTVRGVIGGTHLTALDEAEIRDIADWLDGRLGLLAPSHCTGPTGNRILASHFPDTYESVGVGSEIAW